MSYLDLLKRDLEDAQAFDTWREALLDAGREALPNAGRAAFPEAGLCRSDRIAAVLAVELMQTCALMAVVASVLNALEGRAFPSLRGDTAGSFLPVRSAAFGQSSAALAAEDGAMPLVLALSNYEARLDLALRLFGSLQGDHRLADRRAEISAERAADAWRRACAAALDLDAQLTGLAYDALPASFWPGAGQTRDLLAAAAAGGWPCLDEDGEVSMPGWAERRRSPRMPASQLVTVVFQGAGIAGRLVDVSARGMQIETAARAASGDGVEIVLPDQRRLRGSVRWSRGGRIGVEMDQPFQL